MKLNHPAWFWVFFFLQPDQLHKCRCGLNGALEINSVSGFLIFFCRSPTLSRLETMKNTHVSVHPYAFQFCLFFSPSRFSSQFLALLTYSDFQAPSDPQTRAFHKTPSPVPTNVSGLIHIINSFIPYHWQYFCLPNYTSKDTYDPLFFPTDLLKLGMGGQVDISLIFHCSFQITLPASP